MFPRPSIVFVRLALAYLVVGTGLGALMLSGKALPSLAGALVLRPAHQEMLVVGWLLNLALGTAYWILPRVGRSRGPVQPIWLALWLLNGGIVLVALPSLSPERISPQTGASLLLVGRLSELAALAIFAAVNWPRLKAVRRGRDAA